MEGYTLLLLIFFAIQIILVLLFVRMAKNIKSIQLDIFNTTKNVKTIQFDILNKDINRINQKMIEGRTNEYLGNKKEALFIYVQTYFLFREYNTSRIGDQSQIENRQSYVLKNSIEDSIIRMGGNIPK